jgi:hypothetical protein
MTKNILLLLFTFFSFSAIHAEITYQLSDDGTLTISGTGNMPNYNNDNNNDSNIAPWSSQRAEIKKIVI